MKTMAAVFAALFALVLSGRPALAQADWSLPDTSQLKLSLQPPAAQPAAAALAEKDLSAQFSDESKRNQRNVGSCHTFASVAVLEAAYYRKYKETVRFSEADLFYRYKLQGSPTFEDYNRLMAEFAQGKAVDAAVEEGSWPSIELPFALKSGVSSSWGYDKFMRNYIPLSNQMRAADMKTIRNTNEQDDMGWARQWAATGGGKGTLTLVLSDGTTYPFRGDPFMADRNVDVKTGTIMLAGLFPNPERLLRPGQFAKVAADVGLRKGAILVPQRAVWEVQGNSQVAVVGADNKVDIRPIQIGPRLGTQVVVEKGLALGDKVVVEGTQKVSAGQVVKPVPATPPASAPGR